MGDNLSFPESPEEVLAICTEVSHSGFLFSRPVGADLTCFGCSRLKGPGLVYLASLFPDLVEISQLVCHGRASVCSLALSLPGGLISMLGLWAGGHQPLRPHCFIPVLLWGSCLASRSLSGLILEPDVASYGIELNERALQEFLRHSLPKIILKLYDWLLRNTKDVLKSSCFP